jgi:hypothetical protein
MKGAKGAKCSRGGWLSGFKHPLTSPALRAGRGGVSSGLLASAPRSDIPGAIRDRRWPAALMNRSTSAAPPAHLDQNVRFADLSITLPLLNDASGRSSGSRRRRARRERGADPWPRTTRSCRPEPASCPCPGRVVRDLGGPQVHVVVTPRPLSRISPSAMAPVPLNGSQMQYLEWLPRLFSRPAKHASPGLLAAPPARRWWRNVRFEAQDTGIQT